MPVIATNQWLNRYLKNKIGLPDYDLSLQKNIFGKNLCPYFTHAGQDQIHQHLMQNGLFLPDPTDYENIITICSKDFWGIAECELNQLKQTWNGPDIPVFIFPSNIKNDQLRVELGGKSGVAHQDKLFLFISSTNSQKELQALIVHEYNHVCRLNYLNQLERSVSLLDAMVLEGLAELAVLNRFGEEFSAKWTSLYSVEEALAQWEKSFKANLHVKKANTRHNVLMYGNDSSIPSWMGYNIGFHLVASAIKNNKLDGDQLFHLPSETILEQSRFSV